MGHPFSKVDFKVSILLVLSNEFFLQHRLRSSPQESHSLVGIIESIISYTCSCVSTFCQNSIQISWVRNDFLVANLQKQKIYLWRTMQRCRQSRLQNIHTWRNITTDLMHNKSLRNYIPCQLIHINLQLCIPCNKIHFLITKSQSCQEYSTVGVNDCRLKSINMPLELHGNFCFQVMKRWENRKLHTCTDGSHKA